MQLYREITEYRAGEGESVISVLQNGKRCTIIEKVIGSKASETDVDANGAGYFIVQRLDAVKALTGREKDKAGLYDGRDEPQIHPRLKEVFESEPRKSWSPLAARLIWGICHPLEVA